MQGDLDLDSLWCLEPSIELLGNLAAARFKIARLNLLINRDMNPLDMVVVATHRSVDFDIRGSEPFFTQTRVLWEGRVSATEGMILKHRIRLNTVELQDTIWPAFMSATQTIAQAGSTRVGHSSRKNEPFSITIELDNVRTVSRRTSFSLLWMLASIGGLCFILTFVVRWLLHACARPLHVARLVERMYKRTTDERKSLPVKVIEDDENAEHRPTSRTSSKNDQNEETYTEKMDRKRKRLWNELQVRSKMSFSNWDVVKASFIKLIGATRHISRLNRGMNRLVYDFDIVRVVRTLKNVNTAMKAFLSEPN